MLGLGPVGSPYCCCMAGVVAPLRIGNEFVGELFWLRLIGAICLTTCAGMGGTFGTVSPFDMLWPFT